MLRCYGVTASAHDPASFPEHDLGGAVLQLADHTIMALAGLALISPERYLTCPLVSAK